MARQEERRFGLEIVYSFPFSLHGLYGWRVGLDWIVQKKNLGRQVSFCLDGFLGIEIPIILNRVVYA